MYSIPRLDRLSLTHACGRRASELIDRVNNSRETRSAAGQWSTTTASQRLGMKGQRPKMRCGSCPGFLGRVAFAPRSDRLHGFLRHMPHCTEAKRGFADWRGFKTANRWLWVQVRVRSAEQTRHYVTHALSLFREKGHRSVVLKAMGKAINRLVAVGGYWLAVAGTAGGPHRRNRGG